MRNNVHYEFMDEARTFYNICAAEETTLALTANQLNATLNRERDLLDEFKKSDITRLLRLFDDKRDNNHRGFVSTLEGLTYHDDPEKAAAAVTLLDVVKHYGNIPRMPYDDASAAYGDLLREMSKPDRVALVTLLDVSSWLMKLGASNAEFVEKMLERYGVMDRAKETGRMRIARANSDEQLATALDRIDALVISGSTSTAVAKFVHDYNELATRHKHILAIEKGHRKAAAAPPEEEVPEEEIPDGE